ncbi:MAG: hypothetical protein JJ956_18460 [Pseudomonadales bacterium]|nr:hypothetical protein [Pseudomonadales bacterium]
MTPRALIFAPAFAPDFYSEALVNSKLALAMLEAGWDITVISSANRQTGYSDQWSDPWLKLKPHLLRIDPGKLGAGRRLKHLAGVFTSTRHIVSGALWAEEAAESGEARHREKPFDLVISRSTSCYAHIPALIMKKKCQVPWIANWNDPPSHRFPPPYPTKPGGLITRLQDRYLAAAARLADHSTFPCEELRDYMMQFYPFDLSRTAIVPHIGMPLSLVPAASIDNETSRFRITHAGNLSFPRDPNEFLAALRAVNELFHDISVELEIIGNMEPETKRHIDSLGLSEYVITTPGIPYSEAQEKLAASDLLLVIEAECETGIFLPSKISDYVQTRRPVLSISPSSGALVSMFNQHRFGETVRNASNEIRDVLLKMIEERNRDQYDFDGVLNEISADRILSKIELLIGLSSDR